ncbi:sulfotransferase domain-containing protein [Nafulsella turpanensis]|uniref:sulfotransferase domain-containing protein n=1 Tax=Nafulsella turpanensis TaxID=1265690 RepID=UPI00034DDD6B|nr:sulfotransferase domain-containing protein [Nafulsella turpanensis]
MKILQGGVPKCGNFWLYQIIQQVLKRSGRDAPSFIEKQPIFSLAKEWDLNFPEQARIDVLEITDLQDRYRISSVFNMPIDSIEDYVAKTRHVWTHSPVCKRSGEVFSLFDKKVYIIRDPRDRALSAAKYYCSPYMLKYFPQEETEPQRFLEKNFDKLMQEWVWHVWDHLRLAKGHNIHITFFEGFKMDFPQELERLLNYLCIELSEAQKKELEEAVSFKTLQKKNPKHLRKGSSGYWMEQLSDEQLEKANIIAGPLLRYLHYPEDRNQPMGFSYPSQKEDFEKLRQEIIQSQQLLYQE